MLFINSSQANSNYLILYQDLLKRIFTKIGFSDLGMFSDTFIDNMLIIINSSKI